MLLSEALLSYRRLHLPAQRWVCARLGRNKHLVGFKINLHDNEK